MPDLDFLLLEDAVGLWTAAGPLNRNEDPSGPVAFRHNAAVHDYF
jgi:hypothetical protein